MLGLVRMAMAATLSIVMFLAIGSTSRLDNPFLEAQLLCRHSDDLELFPGRLGNLHVGTPRSLYAWMVWISATLAVLLIAGNVCSNLSNTGTNSLFSLSFPSALMAVASL